MVQAREAQEFVGVTDTVTFTYGEPPEYDLVVRPGLETFLVAAAAVPFVVSAVAPADEDGPALPDYAVAPALQTYFARSPR
jgi:hypothetical protein